jgi:DUF438 domain-containing protein
VSELLGKERKEVLKELIGRLHEGVAPKAVKEEFKEALRGATPVEIAEAEEELIREGMPREEIHRLCEVHLAVFRESLEEQKSLASAGHPIHILMEEHKIFLEFAAELKGMAQRLMTADGVDSVGMERVRYIVERFREGESHYVRELCHPQKSIHVVNRIVGDFRSGRRDVAEFWIQHQGRFVHIRYFAVRNEDGQYLGTLEVTQDITDIKKLDGEKRLLDDSGT